MKAWCLLALAVATSFAQGSNGIRGFAAGEVQPELRLEQQAQALPDTARLRRYMEFMASQPHNAGSQRSKVVAEYIMGMLKQWGLDAEIEEFEALLPFPTVRQIEMLSPKHFTARLREPFVPQDPTSGEAHQLPTYNAYSASGDVTAEVIYANYGVPDDYEWLAKQGIDVKGKIVITRYGKSWRGIKPKVAAEHGAVACILYSDPREDGYFEGDTFPAGPMRPLEGVQRGSVLDMPLYPGDPLSPGWASEKRGRKLPIAEAKTIMKIPVLPISYGDAQPILESLKGPLVPREWRGDLPFTYHAGPGVQVHMKADFDWSSRPIYDVIATIPGAESPDEWVMAGNHHDAWVNGADDPVSGAVALLETARTLATLLKQGWKPRRTIKIALWDGEEFGLLGSTEWAEKHQDELRQKAVAYLNSDNTGKGWLFVSGSHTLEQFAEDLASSVAQPNTSNATLAEAALRHPPADDDDDLPQATTQAVSQTVAQPRARRTFAIGALGAGSDYVAFLDYLGIASMNEGFAGQSKSGIYHSIYDSIYWYTHFSDTSFVDGRALTQFTATGLLRLSGASILPFEFGRFGSTVSGYVDDIEKQAQRSGQRLDFSGVRRQLEILKVSSDKYEALLDAATGKSTIEPARAQIVNRDLIKTERALTQPDGLPNRAWYKHQIYAPGFYTGYGVKTIPGVREAVDEKDWPLAQKEAAVVEQCLSHLNDLVDAAITAAAGL
jgi:N-acetylated-alpha-linked acidic dipeptidase